ncbi:MAG: antitoxin [Acidobacteria bacterium]|nr:MAG: antitoxin [Acidobacteriota bacterium]
MVKTTVYIHEADKRNLERAARQLGKSEAEIIREALRLFVDDALNHTPPRRIVPIFDSGDPAFARRADKMLHGFGE